MGQALTSFYCYCGLMKDPITDECIYNCPPEANPDWLRLQAAKRKARDLFRRREERPFITADDHKRMNRAIARFDPIFRHGQKRARKAAYRSHAVGARR